MLDSTGCFTKSVISNRTFDWVNIDQFSPGKAHFEGKAWEFRVKK